MISSENKTIAKQTDPKNVFEELAERPDFVWLDSSLNRNGWGSRSLIAYDPIDQLILKDDYNHFLDQLDKYLNSPDKIAVGFVGYEAALNGLGTKILHNPTNTPLAHFLIYDNPTWYNHQTKDHYKPDSLSKENRIQSNSQIINQIEKDDYILKILKIKEHIREGDIYQANYTCRFDIKSDISPQIVYQKLRSYNPAPYSAFMNFGDYQVLSSSPERMFLLEDNKIVSTPIKGTIPRGSTKIEEKANMERLLSSSKDKAELLMIVDLVRNDLGRIAKTGSVNVETLLRAEKYSSLIHLMSDLQAVIKNDVGIKEIFKALLPGGSITGAPKIRACEIINQLETSPRSVYTGCIGYIKQGVADFNIAIRTMIHQNGTYHIHAGGGIVADSDPETEYNEMLLKASNLFRSLGLKA